MFTAEEYIMEAIRQQWLDALGHPETQVPALPMTLIETWEEKDCTVEMYRQPTDQNQFQRLMMAFPRGKGPFPAIAVPFYVAGQMMGLDINTREPHPRYSKAPIMRHLLQRGYAVATADAYHITAYESDRENMDFARWPEAAAVLKARHPHWTGVGKLVSDTRRMLDALAADPRVDGARMGIAGFSLGGKMAFYTGCLDERIRAVLAVDFGLLWHQTNWSDTWYWGKQTEELQAKGMDHVQLLRAFGAKPLCILGGAFDTEESGEALRQMPEYAADPERYAYLRYSTEHFPTLEGLNVGYDFLDRWVKGR